MLKAILLLINVVYGLNLTVAEWKYGFRDSGFNWKDINNWEWADGSPMHDGHHLFQHDKIIVNREVRKTPFRTRRGWSGKKIIYFEWRGGWHTDTNIWMLNTKIDPQFGANNGWPYYGELDLFEMFTADEKKHPHYGFSGFRQFKNVDSYGQMTMHRGGQYDPNKRCYCPSSHSKDYWYKNLEPLPSACSAQFQNKPNQVNRMAVEFGYDQGGQFIQLFQEPMLHYGQDNTMSISATDHGSVTPRIINNGHLFWGIEPSTCTNGGYNPHTGFPFFEDFRFILEEQLDGGSFELLDFKVLLPAH